MRDAEGLSWEEVCNALQLSESNQRLRFYIELAPNCVKAWRGCCNASFTRRNLLPARPAGVRCRGAVLD